MGTWRRGVVVGRRRMKKKTVCSENRHVRSMERKLRQLQKIISGGGVAGEVVDADTLFQKIAIYIFLLESRVKLLQSVYALFGPHD
ncbi:hypothetical protein QVD17_29782 [Tagetes erecta]|uniref:BHLH domain-containing protein n=1 Tax=Tagetes erecta TaxID=13708 RepID=A0AAD8K1L3_TARER|nr:hypothetical protein QVD17_29782 [Tagetes erecta]